MANVIEQTVQPASFGGQTIEMTVRSNERGPQGAQGVQGEAATITAGNAYSVEYGQQPKVINSGTASNAVLDFYLPKGQPGAIHYYAGPGINITEDNRIEATGEMAVYWGDLVGSMKNQTDLMDALDAKQDELTAGVNITIDDNVISAKEYTAGSGLELNDGEFSVDTDAIQTKLTAGDNIQIESGTISATDTTYNNFIGANGDAGGSAGLVPAPVATDNTKVLKGDGTWGQVTSASIDKMSLLDFFYPVGSYYETSNTSFDPNVSWGGTWVEDTWGRVTVAYQSDQPLFDQVGEIGGELWHTLTESELPNIIGTFKMSDNVGRNGDAAGFTDATGHFWLSQWQHDKVVCPTDGIAGGSVLDQVNFGFGSNGAHNNLQPYIVVKRWHRTA